MGGKDIDGNDWLGKGRERVVRVVEQVMCSEEFMCRLNSHLEFV